MQGGLLDGNAPHRDRLQDGVGVEGARPTDADADIFEDGGALDGGELVGNGPPRLVADITELCVQVELVYLDYYAVGFVLEAFTLLLPGRIKLLDFFDVFQPAVVGIYLEPQ